MIAADFLDSNILVCAYDSQDPHKQRIAQEIVRKAILGSGLVSVQVLEEFAATFLHKISPRKRSDEVIAMLDALSPLNLVPLDGETVRRAVEAQASYGIHFYDGMIVAAAARGRCTRILSEDLSVGQRYFDIEIANPFLPQHG